MAWKSALLITAAALGACAHTPQDQPDRGIAAVNVPVMTRADYMFAMTAPGGQIPPSELARLDNWFANLELGCADSVYVEGGYGDSARAQVAQVSGKYGILVSPNAPVLTGAVPPDALRVVVSRNQAEVRGCPN